MPAVSFGLPVYNGERFLADTIQSILDQTYTDFEVIVSDNVSTDATLEVARRYAARDSRVRVVSQPRNLGAVLNFATVLREARGQYFAWVGAHDLYDRRWLEESVDVLDANPRAVLAYPWYGGVSLTGEELYRQAMSFETAGLSVLQRVAEVTRMRGGGSRIYGCFRREAMQRVRVHPCAWWDRLFLTSLAVHGEFIQIERVLWHRRHSTWGKTVDKAGLALSTLKHQLRTVHPGGKVPVYCRIPTLWHLACLGYDLAIAPPDHVYSLRRMAVAGYAMGKHLSRMKEQLRVEVALAFARDGTSQATSEAED